MTSPKTAICDACLDYVDPTSLEEICGDMVCNTCINDTNDHFAREDLDDFTEDWDYEPSIDLSIYDDDPNPYHGNYSEC